MRDTSANLVSNPAWHAAASWVGGNLRLRGARSRGQLTLEPFVLCGGAVASTCWEEKAVEGLTAQMFPSPLW